MSVHTANGGFHVKAGLLKLRRSYFAAKVNGNFPTNSKRYGLPTIQGVIVLCDAENGVPLAIMDSQDITSLRTAAATAVAARYLARHDSRVVTICGCGTQGKVQLRAISRIFQFQNVFAYDASIDRAAEFADEMTSSLNIPVKVVTDLSSATRQSDICITCTTSRSPLLQRADVRPGTFIAAIGADNPEKQELHPNLMAGNKIVCDVVDQCAAIGDLHHALVDGSIKAADVHAELGEIVAGKKPGRESADEITIFDSTGMALQDVAAAAFVYEKAERAGNGVRLNLAA
jgi:ornithine cyclodeaminase/alanine dehydrogenase-like protein (mu-crystallin family)